MLFQLGQIVSTPGALKAMADAGITPVQLLKRHINGDWGDLCAEDQESNQSALHTEMRILSAYNVGGTVKVWIITEADRSTTTFLLPEEY
jgi:hypothetical protein